MARNIMDVDGVDVELPDEEAPLSGGLEALPEEGDIEVEDTEDGGAMVSMEEVEAPTGGEKFYDNLAFSLPDDFLGGLAVGLIEKIEYDLESRRKRSEQYEEGLRRTGLGDDAPGGAQFSGASRVVHPMITKAAIEFQSRAVKELLQPGGVVKTHIVGDLDRKRIKKAERKKRFFNWQLQFKIPEFRSELEKALIQSGLAGVSYMIWRWDERYGRPMPSLATVDKVIVNFSAANFYTAERITFLDDITEFEYKERVASGLYLDVDLMAPSTLPDDTPATQAKDRIEGKDRQSINYEGTRRIYWTNTFIEDVEERVGGVQTRKALPYLVSIDVTSHKVLSVIRNWEQDDDSAERLHWVVEWPFVPWDGAMPVGFVHMIGSLSAAATGSLRALLDTAHANNLPASARLKGAKVSGQNKSLRPGEMVEIDAGIGADDIRKLMMPVTYNPPSNVLYTLLEFLVREGEGMVRTAFEEMTNNPGQQLPVGTVMTIVEQGLAVVSAIIGRLHHSMQYTLNVLHRINRMYLTDDEILDDLGQPLMKLSDLRGPLDVIPISDPSLPTEQHRIAQMQAITQRADMKPTLYDQRKIEYMFLERMRVANPDDLLLPAPVPEEMNAVNENAAASMGKPIAAFPEQDHLAHLQVHLDYMLSPVFGMLSIIAPKFLPVMLEHLSQHITLFYVTRMFEQVSTMQEQDITQFMKIRDPKVRAELDRNLAMVSRDAMAECLGALDKLPPIIQQAQQVMAQFAPQGGPMDPSQANIQSTQIREQAQTQRTQMQVQAAQQDKAQDRQLRVVEGGRKIQADLQKEAMRQEAEARRTQSEMQRESFVQENENIRNESDNVVKERINTADNVTAMAIADAEIESGEKVNIETGTGINPNPR